MPPMSLLSPPPDSTRKHNRRGLRWEALLVCRTANVSDPPHNKRCVRVRAHNDKKKAVIVFVLHRSKSKKKRRKRTHLVVSLSPNHDEETSTVKPGSHALEQQVRGPESKRNPWRALGEGKACWHSLGFGPAVVRALLALVFLSYRGQRRENKREGTHIPFPLTLEQIVVLILFSGHCACVRVLCSPSRWCWSPLSCSLITSLFR